MEHDEMYENAEEQRVEFVQDHLNDLIEQFKQENGIDPEDWQLKELELEADMLAPSIEELVASVEGDLIDRAYDQYKDGF